MSSSLPCIALVVASATLVACYEPPPPREIQVWAWSSGPALDQTTELLDAFNRSQGREQAVVEAWPIEERSAPTGKAIVEALSAAVEERRAPALVEVPDVALPALVAAELAWDLDGRDAKRLGVRWEDFHPWLTTSKRLASAEGIAGVPYLHEAPLLALRPGSGVPSAGVAEVFDALVVAASPAEPTSDTAPAEGAAATSPPQTPLAAAADHRLFVSLLGAAGGRLASDDGSPASLDGPEPRAAMERLLRLTSGTALPRGPVGERRAVEAVRSGHAVAALVWSAAAGPLADQGLELRRAPCSARGTYLVVNPRASWGGRQSALRLARWLTEPRQTVELASLLGTVPVRRSATDGARYRRLTKSAPWRGFAAQGSDPLPLPVSAGLVDALVSVLEPALARGEAGPEVLERLQIAMRSVDGEGDVARPSGATR